MFLKDLGIDDCERYENTEWWRPPDVTNAIIHTMVYQEELIKPLIKYKIPITIFRDRECGIETALVEGDIVRNMNFVYQNKYGKFFYGIFHSKLMLFEFDDRLRVIVSSSNLYSIDWETMSQVIWFQDFFHKQHNSPRTSEFEDYLV